ncbi:MAG: bifunctional molybdopterin-guanine dinucleotide biosynthesis adaptor protein MobB/molybdopterin molybdotransferase MoeA [Proteobacteria bacterium]|nr:MAG: bifunctional molybdopterin-guanine dinucleotide biosynthesis adaptor protein MobB/molybdopterin molybdotransferase MoeA [Pseudomonadota bacterium]
MSQHRIEHTTSCASDWEADALSVTDARQHILGQITPVAHQQIRPLRDCLGQILAESVTSPRNVPGHTNSAMDGYALSGDDLPADSIETFRVSGRAMAGVAFDGVCQAGECVRIMTGAMLPAGTDSVVMQEQASSSTDAAGNEWVKIGTGHRRGQNVRHAGEDIAQGAQVFKAGHKITAADLGMLASLGIAELSVKRRLRVAFFSTGDELRSLGEVLENGQIYDSNRYTLHGMLQQCGVDIIDLGVVADDAEKLREAFDCAASMADVVITSGGVSVGEADYIKPTLRRMGEINFWKIAMKPGRPLTYGRLGQAHFFGLPGNPVAVMVTFLQFVKPALEKLSGYHAPPPLRLKARCQDAIRKRPGRTEFQRGIYTQGEDGELTVRLTGAQGSGILRSMSLANCFIILSEEQGSVSAGDWVQLEPIN